MKLQKETKTGRSAEPNRRKEHGSWYGDACGTAFALEILGERWSMLVVRELMFGPRRFSDLRASLPGISAKVLTERLETLAGWGVLEKKQLPPPAATQVYELTEWGYMAERAINELGRWAARSPLHNPMLPVSNASIMSSMKTMQVPEHMAEAPDMAIGMELGAEQFRVTVTDGQFLAERGVIEGCDAVLRAPDARSLAAALYGDVPLAALEAGAGLVVEGERATLERFVNLFDLPPKIGCAG